MTDLRNQQDPTGQTGQKHTKNAVFQRVSALLEHPQTFPVFYVLSGLFLTGTLFIIFNVYVLHLKIESAVVSAPVETMVSPASGVIMDVFVTPGMPVKKNTPLIRIENVELLRDAELAHLQLEDATLTARYLERALENEQKKMSLYKIIGTSRLAVSGAAVNLSRHEVMVTKKNLDRLQKLQAGHYVTPWALDEAATKYHDAMEKLKSASAMENIAGQSLGAVDQGLYYTGDRLEGLVNDLKAQIEAANNRLILSRQRAEIYARLLQKLTLSAPFDGKILQVLKSAGSTTDNTHPILLISGNDAKKSVTAFLTQSEIGHIRAGSRVKIYIPSAGKFYHGNVTTIDRTAGFVDEMNAQFRWRELQTDRSATVTVDISRADLPEFDSRVTAGMPAIVYFPRKFTFL